MLTQDSDRGDMLACEIRWTLSFLKLPLTNKIFAPV